MGTSATSGGAARFAPIVALLVVGVAALAVGWFWLRTSSEAAPAAPAAEQQLSKGSSEPRLALPATDSDDPTVTSRREAAVVQPATRKQPQPLESVTARLNVLNGVTRELLPGAEVRLAGEREVREFEISRGWPSGSDARVLAEIGKLVHANDQGLLNLQVPLGNYVAAAQHGGLSGVIKLRVRPDFGFEGPPELLLFPELALEIQVVDAAGKPLADVEVCLLTEGVELDFLKHDPNDFRPGPPAVLEIWSGVTRGELGLVRIEDPHEQLEEFYGAQRAGRAPRLFADFVFPTSPPAAVQIDPRSWPRGPVQLVMAGLGSVRVVVHDSSGQPTGERAKVYVDSALPMGRETTRIGERELENGRARISGVPFGLELETVVSFYGHRDPVRQRVAGPTSTQPDVEIVMVESSRTPVLFGRFVDGTGAPITSGPVALKVQSRNRAGDPLAVGAYELLPTPTGEFESQLTTHLYEGGSVSLTFISGGFSVPSSMPSVMATRELRSELARLRIELGDVQLVPTVTVKDGKQ